MRMRAVITNPFPLTPISARRWWRRCRRITSPGNALTNYYWDDCDVELSLTYQGGSSLPVSIAEDSALRTVLQLPDHEQLYLRGESYPISQRTFPNTFKVLQEIGAVS